LRWRRFFLLAVEDELDASGNAQLVEDFKQIISNDFLLVRGWSANGRVRKLRAYRFAVRAGLSTLRIGLKPMAVTLAATTVGIALAGLDRGPSSASEQGKRQRADKLAGVSQKS
jgi:hypothetical protein